MSRRVSKSMVALVFALVLSLSAPSAFAMSRESRGFDPDFGTRIVQFVKSLVRHFVPSTQVDLPAVPKP